SQWPHRDDGGVLRPAGESVVAIGECPSPRPDSVLCGGAGDVCGRRPPVSGRALGNRHHRWPVAGWLHPVPVLCGGAALAVPPHSPRAAVDRLCPGLADQYRRFCAAPVFPVGRPLFAVCPPLTGSPWKKNVKVCCSSTVPF